jgi:hypothetical protein
MRNLIVILSLALLSSTVHSQNDKYPEGFYMSFEETIKKSPSKNYNIELEKRSKGKIKMNGGNDYQLNPVDQNINKKFLKRDVYAYSDGTDLYLNCYKYELQFWYTKIVGENDKYFVFNAGLPMYPKRFGIESSNISHMFGGIISGFSAAKKALIRLPYLLDKDSQEVILVSEKNIKDFIGNSTELVTEFDNEPEKDSIETLSKYLLKWINEK